VLQELQWKEENMWSMTAVSHSCIVSGEIHLAQVLLFQGTFLSFSILSGPSLYFTLLFSFFLFIFYLISLLLHSLSSLASVSSSPVACGTFSVK